MIADAFGNLYVISMRGNVFKVNPQTLVADHVAQIKNLPQDYTINGAAVDAQNNVIVSCATKTEHYYTVNISTWEATALPKQKDQVYNASDLASAHVAFESLAKAQPEVIKSGISVYPNPVVNRTINVVFNSTLRGDHNVQLVNAEGHTVLNKIVNVNGKYTAQIILPKTLAQGMYVIKVNDGAGKEQYSGKIVVH
jgi:hypothetical protein